MAVFVVTKEIADALTKVTTKYHNDAFAAETFLQGEWIKYMEREERENEQKTSKRAARVEDRTDRRR